MNLFNFPTSTDHQRHIIFDVEYLGDRQLYHRYRIADPDRLNFAGHSGA